MDVELIVTDEDGGKIFLPGVQDGIEWTTKRKSTPGKLTFQVLGDKALDISEGSHVRLTVDGTGVFYGFVFSQSRDRDGLISVTAYDQLRYLQNKDTCKYREKTAGQLLQMLAADFQLRTGRIDDTGYVIPLRTESNISLFDMIGNALDLTLTNTGEMYVLFDDFGKIALRNIASMKVPVLIDGDTGENYDYSTSIDSEVYNRIKLLRENEGTGKRDVYMTQDSVNLNRWGILQYCDTLKEKENGEAKAAALLNLYNRKTRKLKVSKVFGEIRVRAGCLIGVRLDLGDMNLNNYMLVESAAHKFSEGEHWMDLELRGGDFVG